MKLAFAKSDDSVPHDLQRVIFVHYAKDKARPSEDKGYYKLIGVKWQRFPVHLEVNPDAHGKLVGNMNVIDVLYTIQLAAEEWDEGGV